METNNTPVNIKEFKALIEKYESITLEEIKLNWFINGLSTAGYLTGFGRCHTCTLCIACRCVYGRTCSNCVYKIKGGCFDLNLMLKNSYNQIKDSETPEELFNAFRTRAVILREFAKNNNINIE